LLFAFQYAPYLWQASADCFGVIVGLTHLGQSLWRCPVERHCCCRHVGGEPDQERRTLWLLISMVDGKVLARFMSRVALASISHLVVRSLVLRKVLGAISTGYGMQNSAMISLIWFISISISIRYFLFLIGMFSILMSAMGGSLPLYSWGENGKGMFPNLEGSLFNEFVCFICLLDKIYI